MLPSTQVSDADADPCWTGSASKSPDTQPVALAPVGRPALQPRAAARSRSLSAGRLL
jgi:hypothetical protein